MSNRPKGPLQQLVDQILEDADVYVGLVAALVVLLLDLFGHAGEHVVNAVILLLMGLLLYGHLRGRVRTRSLTDLGEKVAQAVGILRENGREPGFRWYLERHDAQRDMRTDLLRFEKIIFLGVDHQHLHEYLHAVLRDSSTQVPWKQIEVHFASRQYGELFEQDQFQTKLRKHRISIAACLTSTAHSQKLSSFEHVKFFQLTVPLDFSGSMYGKVGSDTNSNFDCSVIYVIHSRLPRFEDLREGVAMRMETLPDHLSAEHHSARIRAYTGVYQALNAAKFNIGEFSQKIWDISAQAWSEFEQTAPVQRHSMSALLDFVGVRPDDVILELGCGSGRVSTLIVSRIPRGSVTLLDGSPQMIALATAHLSQHNNVKFALEQIGVGREDLVDLDDEKFSLIIIHQSFAKLSSSFNGDLAAFAGWCFRKLQPNGRLAIAAHDSDINTKWDGEWEGWEDPLIRALKESIQHVPSWAAAIRAEGRSAKIWEPAIISEAFEDAGFASARPYEVRIIPITMEERIRMWRVPAILDSILDVRKIGVDKIPEITRSLDTLKEIPTRPRKTTLWLFERPDTAGP